MTMGFWYHEDKDSNVRWHWGRTTLFILAAIAVGIIVYLTVAATAGVRGRVALHNKVRSADSQAALYNKFHDQCHAIVAETQQVKTVQASIDSQKASPPANDPFGQFQQQIAQRETDLTGLKNLRDQQAQDYNASAHEPLTKSFMRSKDLPTDIGPPTGTPYDELQCEGAQP